MVQEMETAGNVKRIKQASMVIIIATKLIDKEDL